METLGLTVGDRQAFFDAGGRDEEEIARAAHDLAIEAVENLDGARRNALTDILETGADLWEALEALGVVKLYRDPKQAIADRCRCVECVENGAVRERCDPSVSLGATTVEGLMRASVQPDKRGSRSRTRGAKKKVAGPYGGEPAMATSYAWKL